MTFQHCAKHPTVNSWQKWLGAGCAMCLLPTLCWCPLWWNKITRITIHYNGHWQTRKPIACSGIGYIFHDKMTPTCIRHYKPGRRRTCFIEREMPRRLVIFPHQRGNHFVDLSEIPPLLQLSPLQLFGTCCQFQDGDSTTSAQLPITMIY